jgi:hypothetical protein
MTLLIAWFCIYGFNLTPVWYILTFVVWIFHLAAHSCKGK